MGEIKYLVAVFVNNKNCGIYFSSDLQEVPYIRAIHKGCEIEVHNLRNNTELTNDAINEVVKKYAKKNWAKPVQCIETGECFKSLRDCCLKLHLPYKITYNAVGKDKTVKGYHIIYISESEYRNQTNNAI